MGTIAGLVSHTGFRRTVRWTPVFVAVVALAAQQPPARPEGKGLGTAAEDLTADGVPWHRRSAISPEAVARFRERAADSPEPTDWFNLGAALLMAGDWEGSLPPLSRVADARRAEAGEMEVPAAYDLGLAHAVAGRPLEADEGEARGTRAERREHLLRAREAFRQALRIDPGAEDARWNLELVERWLEEESPPAGGGGGGGGGGSSSEAGGAAQPLSGDELDRLLGAAAAEERRVQEERLHRSRSRDPEVRENW